MSLAAVVALHGQDILGIAVVILVWVAMRRLARRRRPRDGDR